MNDRGKQMMIDAIIKLVDSSPTPKVRPYQYAMGQSVRSDITQAELDIWLNYVNSVLDVLSGYAGTPIIASTKMQISNINSRPNSSCMERSLDIERVLLNLAQDILRYYQ